jgi:hypothetical protein
MFLPECLSPPAPSLNESSRCTASEPPSPQKRGGSGGQKENGSMRFLRRYARLTRPQDLGREKQSMRASVAIAFSVGVVASLCLTSFDAQACGESLFRVGKGVAYRAQTAPLPGNVLVVAPREVSKELTEKLAAAGHHIEVVNTPEEVAQAISSGKFDVVLASYNDRALIAAQTAGVEKAPAYVPVTTEDSQKAEAAQSYERYLSADDDFTQFLRVIHRTLKAKAS